MLYRDGNLAVLLSVGPSDEEKGRQMWRRYLEREDSRIGGKYIDKKISASVGTHFCSRSHGDLFSQGALLLPVAHKTKARVGGEGKTSIQHVERGLPFSPQISSLGS